MCGGNMDKYYEFKNIKYKYGENVIFNDLDLIINKNKIIIVYKDRRRYKWKRLDILIIRQLQRLMKTY